RLSGGAAGDDVGEGDGHATRAESGFNFVERVGGQGSAVFPDRDDVGTVAAKFFAELGLHVDVEVHHGSRDRSGDDHGEEGGGSTTTAQDGGAHQHAKEHRGMRGRGATLGHTRGNGGRGAHASPRRAKTGSYCTARRMAAALPAKVTMTASAKMMGERKGGMVICASKMERPMRCARNDPAKNPVTPAPSASSVLSAKNSAATAKFPAPRAFMRPTSRRRSKMAVAMAAETARAEANRAASVTKSIRPLMRESTVPSFCATWRI